MPSLTDLPGLKVGHAHDEEAATGCTVVLFDEPVLAGIDVGGGSASTRQTDSLRPSGRMHQVDGFLLTGGSAFGLDAAGGCLSYLEERGVGLDTLVARVPSVPTAVLFDLAIGSASRRPDAEMGRQACAAASREPVAEGNVGAGMGCTVAKRLGPTSGWKGGLGSFSLEVAGGRVAALVAVNALGDVYHPDTGEPLAVARGPKGWAMPLPSSPTPGGAATPGAVRSGGSGHGENTTLVVLCTDLPFDRSQLCHLARMAHDGLGRVLRPAHSPFDGDVVFAATVAPRSEPRLDDRVLAEAGSVAGEVVATAIVRGVLAAKSLHGFPAVS